MIHNQNNFLKDNKIDVVITWVDGEDPRHRAKRENFLTKKKEHKRKDIAGETRFNQVGEIYYCIASIIKYASWVNKIYIVTDEQNPYADEFVKRFFPDSTIPVEVVDHKVIFKGYEQYLPTFNSLTITSMLWRIPGLSEHFILFNDDIILQKEAKVEDFYIDGKSVLYGYWHRSWTTKISLALQTVGRRIVGKKPLLSFKRMMLNAANILQAPRIIRLRHSPHTFRKSVFQEFFEAHPEWLIHNIQYRFRNKTQYSSAELYYLLAISQDKAVLPLLRGKDAFISPSRYSNEETKKRLDEFASTPDIFCFCVNSLDQANPESIDIVTEWMGEVIGIDRVKMVEFLKEIKNKK